MQHRPQSVAASAKPQAGEQGYMLLAMVVMVAMVLIALSVAAPVVARELRRDKEVESKHRAEQYVRALRLYYRKFKTYPPSMEALEKSNNVRYLRHQYVDPLTGKADWRIIHVGENQTTVKGFFGQPLGGLDTKGIGGGLGSAAGMASPTGGTSTVGQTSGLAAGFSGATVGTPGTSNPTSSAAPTSATPGTGAAATGGIGAPGTPGGTGTPGGIGGTGSTPSAFGSGGVGQIMGVGSLRSGTSILEPNQQTTYDTWEFLYDPRIELLYAKSNILGGGIGSTSASSFGSDATSGKSNSGSGNVFGSGAFGGGTSGAGAGATGTPATPAPSSPAPQ